MMNSWSDSKTFLKKSNCINFLKCIFDGSGQNYADFINPKPPELGILGYVAYSYKVFVFLRVKAYILHSNVASFFDSFLCYCDWFVTKN